MLKSGERIDDLQRNGLKIIQDPGRFCFGMDAVLLSGFASAGIRQGMRVLDLGTGTGIIPLLLSAKTQAESLCGLVMQADSAYMARRSVAMNHLEDRISVIQGDIKEADKLFAAASFDVVTSNPPYMIGQHGLTNPEAPKAIARHEVLCTFEDIAAQTARLLAPGGSFYLVHRPYRLTELIVTKDMSERKNKMIELGDAFIAFPSGTGTLEELAEVMSKVSLGQMDEPCILYDLNGYYSGLKALLAEMIRKGLSSPERQQGICFARDLGEIRAALHA